MTANVEFCVVLGMLQIGIVAWGVRVLPREHMQILATLPRRRGPDGQWEGVNLTWYGVLQAVSAVMGSALALILAHSVGVPVFYVVLLVGLALAVCLPAAGLMARVVERRKGTFTVGGAVFVGILSLPWAALLLDHLFGVHYALASLSALSISYVFGEGIGRLACISFGCCYGRRLDSCAPWLQRLFRHIPAIVVGRTRKASYAGGCESVPLLPVPALSAVVLSAAGFAGVALFLSGSLRNAGAWPIVVGYAWRFVSEFLRADHRGRGRLSAYQWMALISLPLALGMFGLLPGTAEVPSVLRGLDALWTPVGLLSLGALGVAVFAYLGVSRVTGATVTLRVRA
jgi:hypothetical protein